MDKNKLQFEHILYFLSTTIPVYSFLVLSYFNIVHVDIIILLCTQCVSLSSWLIYTAIVPSLHGEIRIRLTDSLEAFNDYTTSVTTRSSFMTFSIGCLALIGFALFNKNENLQSAFLFAGIFFSIAIILFIVSLDVHDTAKNPPFNNASGTQRIFRRGAPSYQIGQSYIVCGLVSGSYVINPILSIIISYVWVIAYILSNLSTKKIQGYLFRRYMYLLVFFILSFFPILYFESIDINIYTILSCALPIVLLLFSAISIPLKVDVIIEDVNYSFRFSRYFIDIYISCKLQKIINSINRNNENSIENLNVFKQVEGNDGFIIKYRQLIRESTKNKLKKLRSIYSYHINNFEILIANDIIQNNITFNTCFMYEKFNMRAKFEYDLICHYTNNLATKKGLIVGGGALPNTLIIFNKSYGFIIDMIDNNESSTDMAKKIIFNENITDCKIINADILDFYDFGNYDFIILSSSLGKDELENTCIINHITSKIDENTLVIVRSPIFNEILLKSSYIVQEIKDCAIEEITLKQNNEIMHRIVLIK